MYLTQGLHRALQRHPAKLALRHVGAEAQCEYTFERFVSDIARHAAALHARDVRAGDRVAMLSPNNDALIVQLFACWWLGAVACPLNVRWSLAELRHALADCGARLLLVDAAHARAASELQDVVTVAARRDAGRAGARPRTARRHAHRRRRARRHPLHRRHHRPRQGRDAVARQLLVRLDGAWRRAEQLARQRHVAGRAAVPRRRAWPADRAEHRRRRLHHDAAVSPGRGDRDDRAPRHHRHHRRAEHAAVAARRSVVRPGAREERGPHRVRRRADAARPAGPRARRLAARRVLPGLWPHGDGGCGVHQPARQPHRAGARKRPPRIGGPRRAGRRDPRRRRAGPRRAARHGGRDRRARADGHAAATGASPTPPHRRCATAGSAPATAAAWTATATSSSPTG